MKYSLLSLAGFSKMRRSYAVMLMALLSCGGSSTASADEVKTFTYDALGRLSGVTYTGTTSPSVGLNVKYNYDPVGSRNSYMVTGSRNAGLKTVVVPLNGLTVIPVSD